MYNHNDYIINCVNYNNENLIDIEVIIYNYKFNTKISNYKILNYKVIKD